MQYLSGNLTKKRRSVLQVFVVQEVNILVFQTGFSNWFSGTLSLILRLGVPVLPTVPLPGPLSHHQRCHHGNQHGDGDDEHGGGLGDAQLAVHPGQRRPRQLRRILARHVPVVVHVEVADVQDLTEDAMQVAVAAPWVSCRRQQRGERRWSQRSQQKKSCSCSLSELIY